MFRNCVNINAFFQISMHYNQFFKMHFKILIDKKCIFKKVNNKKNIFIGLLL